MSIIIIIIGIFLIIWEESNKNVMTSEQLRIAREQREINRKMDEIRQKTYDKFHPEGK